MGRGPRRKSLRLTLSLNMWGGEKWALSLRPARTLKPRHLIQVVNGPLSADTPLRPKPSLIFGERMSWALQLSPAQLFTFPLSEQSCLCPAAWWWAHVMDKSVSKCTIAAVLTRCMSKAAYSRIQGHKQLSTSKYQPEARMQYDWIFPDFIFYSLGSGGHYFNELMALGEMCFLYTNGQLTVMHLCLFCPKTHLRGPEEKLQLMYALVHNGCVSPLAWASVYFIKTLHTMPVYLSGSRCPKC